MAGKKAASTSRLKRYLPILSWLPQYQRGWLTLDLVAAVTVLALLVPEGMAYAQMAGLPPETAFYTAPAALIGYALFTTSRQVITTTTSTIAVMIAAVLGGLAVAGSEEYIAMAAGLAVLVGLLFLLLGVLRLGFVSEFFSKPVITGFIFGLAMVIAIRQVPKLLGIEAGGETFFERLYEIIIHLPETHMWSMFIGVTGLALLFVLERFLPRLPGALIVVIYGILMVSFFGLEEKGVHVVGDIPAGIAPPKLPGLTIDMVLTLFAGAVGIVVLGYAETIGAARKFASKHRYKIDANQELFGLGVANLGAGIMQGFAVDASLGKSAANDSAGGRTQMSAIIAAGLTILVALFLTPLFRNLPEATLAALVIHAVWGLFDVTEMKRYARLNRPDYILALVALFGVLLFDVIPGLILAVSLSVILLAYISSRPHLSILGKQPDKDTYEDIERYPENKTIPGLLIIRPDGPLFYANATLLRERVNELAAAAETAVTVAVLDLEASSVLDVTSLDAMAELQQDLATVNIQLWLARVHDQVGPALELADLMNVIGSEHVYTTVHDAANAYKGGFNGGTGSATQ